MAGIQWTLPTLTDDKTATSKMKPTRIVLTGGPCAGKSKALIMLATWLPQIRRLPVLLPESASIVFGAMGRPDYSNKPRLMACQKAIARFQMQMEDLFLDTICPPNAVLIADRGVLDAKAFLFPEDWQHLLEAVNLTEPVALQRYDAVIHMVTTANGAPEHYKLEGFRNETPEEAITQDKQLQQVYGQHQCHQIIDNSSDFAGKLERMKTAISAVLEK